MYTYLIDSYVCGFLLEAVSFKPGHKACFSMDRRPPVADAG